MMALAWGTGVLQYTGDNKKDKCSSAQTKATHKDPAPPPPPSFERDQTRRTIHAQRRHSRRP